MELIVYSGAEEVEVLVNGVSIGKKSVNTDAPFPKSALFETTYTPGRLEAVSYQNGQEISRDEIITAGSPAQIRLTPEKTIMHSDGHNLIFVGIEILDQNGVLIPDAEVALTAHVSGKAYLAGFGSANPVTEENYTDETAITYRGRAMAILRAGFQSGRTTISISAEGFDAVSDDFDVK